MIIIIIIIIIVIIIIITSYYFHYKQGTSGAGEGFEVTKYGHGRVALIGFPRCVTWVALLLK